jgi:hypothetical protein
MDARYVTYARQHAAPPPPLMTCLPVDGYTAMPGQLILGNNTNFFAEDPATYCEADPSCVGYNLILPDTLDPAFLPHIGTGLIMTSIAMFYPYLGVCAYAKNPRKFHYFVWQRLLVTSALLSDGPCIHTYGLQMRGLVEWWRASMYLSAISPADTASDCMHVLLFLIQAIVQNKVVVKPNYLLSQAR